MIVADGYDAVANTMEVLALPRPSIVTPRDLVQDDRDGPAEVMPSNVRAALQPGHGRHAAGQQSVGTDP